MASAFLQDVLPFSQMIAALSNGLMNGHSVPVTIVLFTVFLVFCTTRLFSGLAITSEKDENGAKPVRMLPYWFPYLGHAIPFVVNPNGLLYGARDKSSHGAFALNIAGTAHNIIFAPSLIKSVLQKRAPHLDFDSIILVIGRRFFGAPQKLHNAYLDTLKDVHEIYNDVLLRGPHLASMLSIAIRGMEEQIPNLVTFVSSPVDQLPWERASDVDLVEGSDGKVVEANLCMLIRESLGHLATPALMGRAFMDNNPSILQDLWTFDYGFQWLITGLPRWAPIPRLTRAHLARERLLIAIEAFQVALDLNEEGKDPGSEWRDMDDVSEHMKRRHKVWRQKGLSPRGRAPCDLGILWAMNANANTLCFWMIMRILADPTLTQQVRDEVKPHVPITQLEPILGMQSPPRLKISSEGLATRCPLFKACYLEALRLDSAPCSVKTVQQDFVISESLGETRGGSAPETYVLRAGSYVDIPYDVHQMDPRYYPHPDVYDPRRFLVPSDVPGEGPAVHAGTLRPYGGGHSMCKGRNFAEPECLVFVAGVLTLWDIEPANPTKAWAIPRRTKATAVALPASEVRVRIRRRRLD